MVVSDVHGYVAEVELAHFVGGSREHVVVRDVHGYVAEVELAHFVGGSTENRWLLGMYMGM